MKLKTMREEVQEIVKDAAFDSKLNGYINEAYQNAVLEAKLPEYKRVGAVKTSRSANFISVSDSLEDFGGVISTLFKTVTGSSISIYAKAELMFESEGTDIIGLMGTEVKAIALEGTNLWYTPIPSEPQLLSFFYVANPDLLEYDNDEITLFPELVQRKICIHGACVPCFEQIEDGVEGPKVNTEWHRAIYNEGIQKLKEWNGRRRRHSNSSRWEV